MRRLVPIALCGLLLGCAHFPTNTPAQSFDPTGGYRFEVPGEQPDPRDSLFICLTFSGGGTRAAALAYGVLAELRDTPIGNAENPRSLLDEVDCISSVSGGSFTAAYFALFRERIFQDFRSRFLERNIQGSILRRVLTPTNWLRLASPTFSRVDLAAEFYHEEIFDEAQFADMAAIRRPFVIINATNAETGQRFDFTQRHFDMLGSDLMQYPVARAVAASSAYPFLLAPVTLENFPEADGYEPPFGHEGTLLDRDRDRFEAAKALEYYRGDEHRWIHLMDGGLADNVGTRAIVDAYRRGFINQRLGLRSIGQLVVIVVNARTETTQHLSESESPPGLAAVALKTSTASMDNYSFESVARMIAEPKRRLQAQRNIVACNTRLETCGAPRMFGFGRSVEPYVIEVGFDRAGALEGESAEYYLNLPTSFSLSTEQVRKLIAIGPKLMKATPQYQCLLAVLSAENEGRERPKNCPIEAGISGY